MGIEAANKLQAQIQDGRQKYTYFLLPAAGTCIWYAVEKATGPALQWRSLALAAALGAWAVSFWLGCRAVKRNEYGLQYNHAWHIAARSPIDKVALDALMSEESKSSASSSRWHFASLLLAALLSWFGDFSNCPSDKGKQNVVLLCSS